MGLTSWTASSKLDAIDDARAGVKRPWRASINVDAWPILARRRIRCHAIASECDIQTDLIRTRVRNAYPAAVA